MKKRSRPEEIIGKLRQAKVLVEKCRRHYNRARPQSSLGNIPPARFAARCAPSASATLQPSEHSAVG